MTTHDTSAHPWDKLASIAAAERQANLDDRRLSLGAAFRLRRRQPITAARREALERRGLAARERRRGDGEEALLCERAEVTGGARSA